MHFNKDGRQKLYGKDGAYQRTKAAAWANLSSNIWRKYIIILFFFSENIFVCSPRLCIFHVFVFFTQLFDAFRICELTTKYQTQSKYILVYNICSANNYRFSTDGLRATNTEHLLLFLTKEKRRRKNGLKFTCVKSFFFLLLMKPETVLIDSNYDSFVFQ